MRSGGAKHPPGDGTLLRISSVYRGTNVTPPAPVLKLVKMFLRNRQSYRRPEYREHQLRREFIDPLFESLGWDIHNRAEYAEAYKDVVTELPTRIGGTVRAPDYAFRVGGSPKFLVEAKAPRVDVGTSREGAFQLRRYGFSMGLSLSILTDFEEFAFYDTRSRPSESDDVFKSRVRYFTCKDIEREWRWLEGTFSKDAVLRGELDRFAQEHQCHRGTAGIDGELLVEIERWRELIARNVALRNHDLTVELLNWTVQQLIDRIIFLRIVEDRGIEPYGQLRSAAQQKNVPTYRALLELFVRADHRYNSGLFHFWDEPDRTGPVDTTSPALKVDDNVLDTIITNLYYPKSPYEFSVIPAELLGRIYERFLGKTIRLTPAHRAVVDEKPEVRLRCGVYYTPDYIIGHIVERTLGQVLRDSSADAITGKRSGRRGPLTVVDIACGSGSFLLGAYSALLNWYLEQYLSEDSSRHARGRPPRLYRSQTGQWQLTISERNRILVTHIFGVDRDAQAVEKTKLSLLLKVLEGATETLIKQQLQLLQDRVLPDLGHNIKCGNSLIGPDYYSRFSSYDAAEDVGAFCWEQQFPAVMAQGGFAVVIGNPPYVRIHRIPHNEADYLFATYRTVTGKSDLCTPFIERALELLRHDGVAGLITTSQWTATDYGRLLRKRLSEGVVGEIVNFGSLPVFQDAETYPAIFIMSNARHEHVRLREVGRTSDLRLEALRQLPETLVPVRRLSEKPWNLQSFDLEEHLKDHTVDTVRVSELAPASIGDLTGLDSCFVVSAERARELSSDLVIPYASRGSEVFPFEYTKPSRYVIYPYRISSSGRPTLVREAELRSDHPEVYRYLLKHRPALRKRKDSRKFYADGPDWYRHLRPGPSSLIKAPKLAVKGIDKRSTVGLLAAGAACNGANVPCLAVDQLNLTERLALMALLNSKLAAYYLRGVCPPKLGGYTRFTSSGVNSFPIRGDPTGLVGRIRGCAELASCADEFTRLQSPSLGTDRTASPGGARWAADLWSDLDALVYDLYGLAPEQQSAIDTAVMDRPSQSGTALPQPSPAD